jgi:predicted HNH restriction endonuclease
VCSVDFGTLYGPLAEGFIHVHHLVPLAIIGKEYQIDPIADLRPVCPNCHAVIHLRTPPLAIYEAKALLGRKDDTKSDLDFGEPQGASLHGKERLLF